MLFGALRGHSWGRALKFSAEPPQVSDRARGSTADARQADDGTRVGVKAAAAVALVATALLAIWLIRNWLRGAGGVVAVSSQTVDGARAGWVLALVVWLALLTTLVLAIRAGRRSGSWRSPLRCRHPSRSAPDPSSLDTRVELPVAVTSRWTTTAPWIVAGAVLVVSVYHGIFLPGVITWGDWGYFINASAVRSFFPVPSLWSFANLGTVNILGGALAPVESAMGAMARVGVSYAILERVWFYLPAVALSYCGATLLALRVGARSPVGAAAGAFYAINPYALVLVSGGQLTVGVGYSLLPWVALAALGLWSKKSVRAGLLLGSVVAVQAWFDPRSAGLSIGTMLLALVVFAAGTKRPPLVFPLWKPLLASALVFVLAQGPWLVPAMLAVPAHLPVGYTTTTALATFSLMSLADGLTVFHPFWPTMHFIALHSVPVLWLVVPAMVAAALWRAPYNPAVQVGSAIYLTFGALVSGANRPFGPINSWLFVHVPGMDLFRDPSPYFGPTALGVVIAVAAGFAWPSHAAPERPPVSASTPRGRAWRPWSRHLPIPLAQFLLALGGVALVAMSGWPALSGALGHALAPRALPARYVQLANDILHGPPGVVLWIPTTSRFAPVTPAHPSVSAFDFGEISGVDFPDAPPGLAWLDVPSVVRAVLQEYDIRTVVVRDDATAYRELSLLPSTTKAAALASLTSLGTASRSRLPGLTLFQFDAQPYPLSLFTRRTALPIADAGQPSKPEVRVTSFSDLRGWQPVGDGNNYLHQTLRQAGISEVVSGGGSFVRLTVQYGAAVISRPLASCPAEGLQRLRIRYRTSQEGTLTALIFSAAQGAPLASVALPPSPHWTDTTSTFVLAPSLPTRVDHVPLRHCSLELSAQPTLAGARAAADVGAFTVAALPARPPACASTKVLPNSAWCNSLSPFTSVMAPGGDRVSTELPPSRQARLLVLWQAYNPGWSAGSQSRVRPRHVRVDGWANGFVIPATSRALRVEVTYEPQKLVVYGYVALLCALALVLLGGASLLIERWVRRRRQLGQAGKSPSR